MSDKTAATDVAGRKRGRSKTQVAVVVSDSMDKTRVVAVARRILHPRYKKYISRRKRFKAHDAKNETHVGDKVLIVETRPLSADKRWRIRKIIERAL